MAVERDGEPCGYPSRLSFFGCAHCDTGCAARRVVQLVLSGQRDLAYYWCVGRRYSYYICVWFYFAVSSRHSGVIYDQLI